MSNPAIAEYEAAYKLLKEPCAFVTKGAHPHPAPLLFRLTGMDEPLAWPLCSAQAAQIAALYPNKLISESDIHFESRYLSEREHILSEIDRVRLPHLGPSNGAFMDLSHMVVDDVGDADLFRLQPSDDDEANATTFGVLIVLLPSVHTGGVITFTYGNHSETFDDDTSLLETSFAAAFLSTVSALSTSSVSWTFSCADTRELLLGAIPYFGFHGPTLVKSKRMSPEEEIHMLMHKNDLPRNLSLLEKMQRLLTALGDVAVSATFIDTITMGIGRLVDDIAPVVHILLVKHGWEALQSSMLRLVQRWIETDPDATMQLLMSLAGLNTESSVCPPLSQPFEAELFKRCYDVVLATPSLFTETKGMLPRGPTSVMGLFLLEHYLATTAAQLQDAHYASQRLPLSLVPAIDAFLFANPSLSSLFCSSAEWHPLKDLGVGLASAVRCQPSLPLPPAMIDEVLAAMQAPMTPRLKIRMAHQQADIAAAVLVLASLSQRLDAALFDILVDIYGLRLLPIVASIASQLPDDAIVGQLVAAYIDSSVDTLVDEAKWPEPFNRQTYTGRYMEATYTFGADIFVSAVELLLRFAPDTALAFASRWLQLLPTTLDELHDRLVPVVPRLDRHSSVFRLLFSAMIDRFTAVSELLNIVSLAAPSPRDVDPDHCNQCRHADFFLAQSDMTNLKLYRSRPDVCVDLARVVDANATRLCFVTGDDGKCRLEKVRQPNQASPTEWDVHHAKMKTHARIAACIASLTSTVGGEPEDASNESTEPPAKRVRRS
ncbi:hypothetical protein SPRG_08399 [Saprolegnia parasitica CBS 223.65]|uniref:Uncharacterized protein n=1 Tax=Saprolegnia parasitica (strain CBS 223.65) TaxID=695850 RepID=A0A067CIG3_SAPPC|nr:hypothetical protein SPRG_08399 [Saprolegnia parasitica CBS 223.65]KDO26326.1 hypothetical protein SPRG_08399 [Saprolegnia parasitica CBS 223.65]|eukprot:XP_012203025.1 hypothetical protein SPRG_08399 [Saprolegnia parasitica CBS 223.65]